jgi:hypothetical protein
VSPLILHLFTIKQVISLFHAPDALSSGKNVWYVIEALSEDAERTAEAEDALAVAMVKKSQSSYL